MLKSWLKFKEYITDTFNVSCFSFILLSFAELFLHKISPSFVDSKKKRREVWFLNAIFKIAFSLVSILFLPSSYHIFLTQTNVNCGDLKPTESLVDSLSISRQKLKKILSFNIFILFIGVYVVFFFRIPPEQTKTHTDNNSHAIFQQTSST